MADPKNTPKSLPAEKASTLKKKKVLPKAERQLLVPAESFAVANKTGGGVRIVTKDTPLWSDDPIVKKHRDLFITLEESLVGRGEVVHTATSIPGVNFVAPGDDPADYLAALGDE